LSSWVLNTEDWIFIEQVYKVLLPFNKYTKLISEGWLTINQSQALFYKLSDYFESVQLCQGNFATFNNLISSAIKAGTEKFIKYNNLIKENIIYFVVSVLDPRVKRLFILNQANSREILTVMVLGLTLRF
jgi:hypothetical protein